MKHPFKKVGSLLAVTIMVMGSIVGCSSTGGDKGEETSPDKGKVSGKLDVAVFEGGFGTAFWEEAEKQFESKYPDVDVVLNASPNIGDVIRPQIASGNSPDFIYHSAQNSQSVAKALIKDKNLADLTDVFEKPAPGEDKPIKEKMMDGLLDKSSCAPYGDGKVYLAPLYYNVTGLWYNKALFEEKGWEVPKTWDEFYALGEKAKAEGIALFTYQGQHPGYLEALVWPVIASEAGEKAVQDIFNYEKGAWEKPEVKAALQKLEKIGKDGYLLKGTPAMCHIQAQTAHLKGEALFAPNGNWYEGEMKDAVQDGWKWGFTAPPAKEGSDQYVSTMIEEMYIPGNSDNIETAKEFMRFLYSDEMVEANAKLNQGVVPTKNALEMAKQYIPESNYNCLTVFDNGVKPIVEAWKTVENTEINMREEVFNKAGSVFSGETSASSWADGLNKSNEKLREAMNK
ncbi:carbohydrate ABC transporter substrate-binding protein [Romboutsia lituseburensis]|uniref:carbohydrate ABC transporter substrate-binding protein n=1 Tax=Romboutsia lituseburensis TaxID=1537 RepID=UPI00215AA069|nr:carbohydrate ABC transporter substrate-binding protein [Romboutsia lituseburensis]MCR8744038.1 carbohydrate ABC transporter substrate-binding protein [Romboutsia lituseburensis]